MLAGWQAALEHPVAHVDTGGEFVHLYGGHSPDDGSEAGLLCDTLAALTACAAKTPAVLASQASSHERVSNPVDAPRVAHAPPFLSQGPPTSA